MQRSARDLEIDEKANEIWKVPMSFHACPVALL